MQVGQKKDGPESKKRTVSLIGTGMGSKKGMTQEALAALDQADLIFGAERMLRFAHCGQTDPFGVSAACICEYRPQEVCAYLLEHPLVRHAVVLLSGDTGFFSGAKKLTEVLAPHFDLKIFCGISSMSYLAAKLCIAWDDMVPASQHGRDCNLIGLLARKKKVFVLFSDAAQVRGLAAQLLEFGMGQVQMAVGNNLGQTRDRKDGDGAEYISGFAPPETYLSYRREGLHAAVLVYAQAEEFTVTAGIADDAFARGADAGRPIPMTKEEVRVISLSKLRLREDSILFDIGAGTGSVSVEAARLAYRGMVYAFEKNPVAAALIRKNRLWFQTPNLTVVEGDALTCLRTNAHPVPTHAFLGGTGGSMADILDWLYARNPNIQIVANTVTLESLSEILAYCAKHGRRAEYVQVAVSSAREAGVYHMMQARSPVMVVRLYHEHGAGYKSQIGVT
ncbi:MAG: precorrin-6y C5,15-methyltransferase (decarboxylating) subunit CbiE [Eubacterium sp.]|nr:precorrin-6y C5,15-methyltransferase (decarboxylating) subunit CbiE [Eubacterium sp.]